MSSSGKIKKKKYRPVAIEEVLPNAVVRPSTTSWAEEVEDELHLSEYALKKINSINLPTAPRAARDLVIDESKIPPNGPFRAYMSNLPFETTEEDVANLFSQLKIEKIELPRDRQDRMKGFGYIEFRDKSSLLVALQEGELTLKSRLVRISLLTDDDNKGSRGNTSFTRNRDMSDRFDRSDKPMEWRTAAPIPHDPEKSAPKHSGGFTRQSNFRDRERDGSSGGGPFRESRSGFSSDFDKSSSFSRAFRDRDRDDHISDRDGGRTFTKRFGDRDRDRDRDRDDRGSRSSLFGKKFDRDDREREFKRDSGFKRDTEFKRDPEFKREPAPEREEPKTRPKIELQPRSKPLDTNPAPAALPSSIFGAAKPVDTARREQEIELKLESSSRNRVTSPVSNATPNRSRSSSVSSVSSIRRQQPDFTEPANESTKSNRTDNESEKPKEAEFKEPAPPPPNVWLKRSEENAAAAAAAAAQAVEKISSNVVDSSVIDKTTNAGESPKKSEEKSMSQVEECSSTENVDKLAAECKTTDLPAASEKPRDQPSEWTTYSTDSFDSDQPPTGGRGGRFIGGNRYESSNNSNSNGSNNHSFSNSSSSNKYSSFSRDNRREKRENRRSDVDRRGNDRRSESSRYFKNRDDNYGGNRSESGPFGGSRENQFRNRNGNGHGRRDDRGGGNFSSFRDRNDYSSASSASLRSSTSISNLRDESGGEKLEERKAPSNERLTANDVETCNDAREQTKSPFEQPQPQPQQQQQNAEDRLPSTVASDAKPLENGDENGALDCKRPSATHANAAPTSADQSGLNDGTFSSSKSRKKSIKKKTEKSDDASADKDILKPIENDRKANNQKDEKKKTTDSQVNDKTTNNNNAKGKESNRSKKNAKKSRDIQDTSQPKQKEEKAPNFQGSNRYQLLEDDS